MSNSRLVQSRVFGLTWLSYASYYITRKPFSVAKSALEGEGMSVADLAAADTFYLALYAAGQFVSGALGDRVGPRRMLAAGMLLSAAASLAFGFGEGPLVFTFAFALQGAFQSTGWPNNVGAMAPHFSAETRGRIMGLWCTCYQVGGIVSTALAGYLLATYGWRRAFIVPAVWVACVGLVLFTFLPRTGEAGDSSQGQSGDDETERVSVMTVLRMPVVWIYGLSYAFLKLIRYSLLFWLPFYLERRLELSGGTPSYLATSFEVGGVVGAVLIGFMSDRLAPKNRAKLLAPLVALLPVVLFLYPTLGNTMVMNAVLLIAIGVLIVGPEALITGAVPQDIGGASASTAAGVINGMGSIGAIMQGFVVAGVSQGEGGWESVFYTFVVLSALSAAVLFGLRFFIASSEAREPDLE